MNQELLDSLVKPEEPVSFKRWNQSFFKSKTFAEENGLPLVGVWLKKGDTLSDEVSNKLVELGKKLNKCVLWLGIEGDGYNGVGSRGFWWMTGSELYRETVKTTKFKRYPILRLWWKDGPNVKADLVHIGEIVDIPVDDTVGEIIVQCSEYFNRFVEPPKEEKKEVAPVKATKKPAKKENAVVKAVKSVLKKKDTKKKPSKSKRLCRSS